MREGIVAAKERRLEGQQCRVLGAFRAAAPGHSGLSAEVASPEGPSFCFPARVLGSWLSCALMGHVEEALDKWC